MIYDHEIGPRRCWLDREIQVRLNARVAVGHPWKQLLQMASEETIREVYQTLQAYTVLRYPLEPRKTDSASFDYAMALELLNRAEQCQNHDIMAAVGVARDRAGEAETASPYIALPRL
jgi:hypothetical protein